jgi:hypothetical protein
VRAQSHCRFGASIGEAGFGSGDLDRSLVVQLGQT